MLAHDDRVDYQTALDFNEVCSWVVGRFAPTFTSIFHAMSFTSAMILTRFHVSHFLLLTREDIARAHDVALQPLVRNRVAVCQ